MTTVTPEKSITTMGSFTLTGVSYADFAAKAHLVPVRGQFNSWQVHETVAGFNALHALRGFIRICQAHWEQQTVEPFTANETDTFMANSLRHLLDREKTVIDPLWFGIGPCNHTLIFYRAESGPLCNLSRETLLGLVWQAEQSTNPSLG